MLSRVTTPLMTVGLHRSRPLDPSTISLGLDHLLGPHHLLDPYYLPHTPMAPLVHAHGTCLFLLLPTYILMCTYMLNL